MTLTFAALTPLSSARATQPGVNGAIFLSKLDANFVADIYKVNGDGTGLAQVTNTPLHDEAGVTTSPDGTKLAWTDTEYDAGDPGGLPQDVEVWTGDANGTNATELPDPDASANSFEPSWNADGTKITYTHNTTNDVRIRNSDGSGTPVVLIPAAGMGHDVTFSPDGTRMAYTFEGSAAIGGVTIRVANVDGSNATDITPYGTGQLSNQADWSPDGQRIVFSSDMGALHHGDEGESIWTADSDGGNATLLVHAATVSEQNFTPVWSPDGTKIAYEHIGLGGVRSLVVMDADGGNPQTLIASGVSDYGITWQSAGPPPSTDADGDGIDDAVDTDPGNASEAFADTAGTTGTITDRAGLAVTVKDAAAPADGVRITAGAGSGQVSLDTCAGFPVTVDAGSALTLTCGSVRLNVSQGAAHVVLGGTTVNVPAGSIGKVTDNNDGTFTVENLGGSGNVTITSGGTTTTLTPGQSDSDVTAQAPQTITFGALAPVAYSPGGTFGLGATASSGLAVSYSATGAACTVSPSGTVTIAAAGTCAITASQPGNASYAAATQVTRTLTVTKASTNPSIGTIANKIVGAPAFAFSVTGDGATTTPNVSVTPSSVCTLASGKVKPVGVGTCTVKATQAADANHNAGSATRSFAVSYAVSATSAACCGAAGFTVTLKDATGKNVGTSAIVVHAATVDGLPIAAQPGQPHNNFTWVAKLKTYAFALKTVGLSRGTHTLAFTTGSDPIVHTVTFRVP